MARVFAVTASTDRLRLDASGRAEVSFTISNTAKRLLRSRVKVQPLGAAGADWFSLAGEADRDLAPDATHQVTVRIAAPATAAGTFTFQLRVVSIDNPDEDWTDGPATAFEAAGVAKPAGGKFPWWILVVVGAVVLIAGGVAAFVFTRPAGLNDPCKGDKCAAGLVCGPAGTCLGDTGYEGCKANGDCVFASCKDGVCGKPGLGMACPGGACDANLECVGGICLKPSPPPPPPADAPPAAEAPAAAKTYKNVATGFCLDSNPERAVYAIGCNGGNYQNWTRDGLTLRNVSTGFCLDSNAEGKVYTLGCNGGDYQKWESRGQLLVNVATGRCLDSNPDRAVYTLGCNGGDYQNWR